MAASTTLNARNLEKLGAPALAALLMEVSTGHGAIKRRLRLALADVAGPDEIAAQVRKRIATIAKARGRLDWQQLRALIADLSTQHAAIVGPLAASDPKTAHELLWAFLGLADRLFDRTEDGGGHLVDLLRRAASDIGRLSQAAAIAPPALADRVFDALTAGDQGQYDGLIATIAPLLGAEGRDRLKKQIAAWGQTEPTPEELGPVIGYGLSGPLYAHSATRRRAETARRLLRDMADAEGDVDAYIAHHPDATRRQPLVATAIARRLLAAGRADTALATLDAAHPVRAAFIPADMDMVRLDILETLGRADAAQALRWERFQSVLHAGHLRDHLRRLPDFDDFEAEQRALALVERHNDVHAALAFLIEWPAPERAARMVLARRDDLDGNRYEVLSEAADRLDGADPLAATILRRAIIDFTLRAARSARYGHAARHLAECATADVRIVDHGDLPDHAGYVAALRRDHGRKTGFWEAVANG
ncbi:MAG TPA: hypothetical protein VF649_02340 [Sphingomonas sp.]|uniref:DUF6880 family protein n=1 Tax=Sphingomonas sp. TaxID=28214 RepID=UPI002EDB7F4A